jgi:UDPglucose 6-dehydrogenase
MREAAKLFTREIAAGKLILADSKEIALNNSDALAIVTEWNEFKTADINLFQNKVIFDGRNLFEPGTIKEVAAEYFSIGRV